MQTNRTAALQLMAIAAGMLMLAFASVPLYRLFCQVTGFGGTTQRGDARPPSTKMLDRTVTVTFDANVDPHLPWKFYPLQKNVRVKLGENKLVAYGAENEANAVTKATATYNVTPFAAGRYFNKIQCFCFSNSSSGPTSTRPCLCHFMSIRRFSTTPETREVTNITLSYTFYSYESANKSKF